MTTRFEDVSINGTCFTSNWFRSDGTTGWYNQTYGGGIWMQDYTWIRTYGGKYFYCDQWIRGEAGISWGNGNNRFDPNSWDRLIICANSVNTGGGYFYYNQGNSYGTISDRRIKTDIVSIPKEKAINFIKQLNPVTFGYKDNEEAGKVCGFIAQDVLFAAEDEPFKNIVPNHETYDESKEDCPYLGVSDHQMTPSIVATVQYLINTIETQQKTIENLEARLKAIEDLLK